MFVCQFVPPIRMVQTPATILQYTNVTGPGSSWDRPPGTPGVL